MRTRITDEFGVRWVVEAGDPARKFVNRLSANGFAHIVLTRAMLRGKIERAGQQGQMEPAMVRLADCEALLEREGLLDGSNQTQAPG